MYVSIQELINQDLGPTINYFSNEHNLFVFVPSMLRLQVFHHMTTTISLQFIN